MEELRPLTSGGARQSIPRKAIALRSADSYGPLDYEQVDASHPSAAVRQPLSKRVVPGPFNRIWTYAWVVEISSFFLATLALAAIFIMLAIHSDRPMPQWPKLISINSLIAIFTAVLKAALMMPVAQGIGQLKWHWFHQPRSLVDLDRIDAASRGPWGSFLLMFTTYKHSLAICGAFITVAALAIDPFSQQVIRYYECQQPILGSIASIPKTNNYTRSGPPTSGDSAGLDNTMAAALYVGLIQPPVNSTSSIPVQCSTGNCTFPKDHDATHSSLAMCSSCTDISETVSRNKTQTNSQMISYYLQSGPKIGWMDHTYASGLIWMASIAYSNADSTPGIDYISGFDALMYRANACTNASEIHQKCDYEPFAVKCFIYPCVKTYRANITNFVLEETLLNTTRVPMAFQSPQVNSSFASGFTLLSSSVLRNGMWGECIGMDEPSKTNPAAGPEQWTTKTKPPTKYYPNDCIWNFGWESTQALSFNLYNLFAGDPIHSTLPPHTPATSTGNPWQLGLFSNGNATLESANAYMEGLANAMTSIIRQNGDTPSTEYAHGTAYGSQTCIRVQWAWLSLPSALIVLAVAFLIATILETRSWQITWKSSALALLFHGLDARSREQYGAMVDLTAMKDAAEEVQAELTMPESGWRLVIK